MQGQYRTKYLITGGTGMLGKAFESLLPREDVFYASSLTDLRYEKQTNWLFQDSKPEYVIHLAAKVGGVSYNKSNIADFYIDNSAINTNVLNAAKNFGVKKVISLLSTCIYPENGPFPLKEENIHLGEPHPSNFGYAYAKRMLDVHSRVLREQHGCNFITAVPNNLMGEHDNFDLENGHVMAAIIRKIWEAKTLGKIPIFWGSGNPLREFTYTKDIARSLLFLLENYDGKDPVNIGNTSEVSIREIVQKVCSLYDYSGPVEWDSAKPEGIFRKPSCNQKFLDLGWEQEQWTPFDTALGNVCSWFSQNYPFIRGV